ncbi:hypothetical protein F383_36592 [Gossypium arboreum]|uniref:Uncharacterized protein n=1 Tax=Gossypium arboreum TaxID=29729 RepID=A0A0B0N992_GOSAR|nr:hypothetical protein F383_36592 [Gossypium arboreum]
MASERCDYVLLYKTIAVLWHQYVICDPCKTIAGLWHRYVICDPCQTIARLWHRYVI